MQIRVKMTVMPIIVLLVPIAVSIFYIDSFGRSYYEAQKGILYLTIAKELVDGLEQGVLSHSDHINYWVQHAGLLQQLETHRDPPFEPEEVERIEQLWPELLASDEPLQSILNNSLSEKLRLFNRINPVFAEILLTDRYGRLIAATNPTTDYWQADELWWQAAVDLHQQSVGWMRGIKYDESAGIQAMDISLPIQTAEGKLLGVIKGSLRASEVLRVLAPNPWNEKIIRDVLFRDGRLIFRLNPSDGTPHLSHASRESLNILRANPKKWQAVELYKGVMSLAACVPVSNNENLEHSTIEEQRIYVVVHRDRQSAMAPVTGVIRDLIVRGSVLLILVAVLSLLVSTIWFTRPLKALHRAAKSMSEYFRRQEEGQVSEARNSLQEAGIALKKLNAIQTRDEIQELAGVFSNMGGIVLNFHRELKRELTRKTEEINEDLVMAREFQEALLPHDYPQITYPVAGEIFSLNFNHIYRPAQLVSGDFFDTSEISKGCIRVFIADVMGHGARSALMTAILHALLSNSVQGDSNPAHLLQRMNEEFYALGQRMGEIVFVTAVHLIIDLRQHCIRYASAGHPPPLVIDHESGSVLTLVPEDQNTPAAGLFLDSSYTGTELPIDREQTILLYTDGVTEAQDPMQEEFGRDRLFKTVKDGWASGRRYVIADYLIETLDAYMDTAPTQDDICLVSIDIAKARKDERAAKGE